MKAAVVIGAMLLGSPAWAVMLPGVGEWVEAGGYLDGLAVAETEGRPRQRPQGLLALLLDGRVGRRVRGHLGLRTRVGGPFEGGHGGVYDLVHAFQNRSPALEVNEAWADVLFRRADLRVGVQKLAWGKLDGIPPTDVLNPRDYHDPLVADFEERKIGIPAVRATVYAPRVRRLALEGLRATLVYVPIAVPSRLALTGERWFPGSVTPGSLIELPRSQVERALADALGAPPGQLRLTGDVRVPVAIATLNRRPPKRLDAGGIGLRLGGTVAGMDWDVYHYTGPEAGPNAELRPTVILRDLSVGPDGDVELDLRVRSVLRQAHDVMHMTGADWSASRWGATFRAEAAAFQDRPTLREARSLFTARALRRAGLGRVARRVIVRGRARVPLGELFVDRDSVEWGVGADYLIRGVLPLVQVTQTVFTDSGPRPLVRNPETRLSGSVRTSYLGERVEVEVRGTYALEPGSWLVFPRLAYRPWDDLRLRLGYLAIGGSPSSLIGQFGDNDEVVLEARYSF